MLLKQVLTVNQVVEILLKFLETKDWRSAFFQVIPQRKRGEIESKLEDNEFNESVVNDIQNQKESIVDEDEDDDDDDDGVGDEAVAVEEEGVLMKKQRIGEVTNAETQKLL